MLISFLEAGSRAASIVRQASVAHFTRTGYILLGDMLFEAIIENYGNFLQKEYKTLVANNISINKGSTQVYKLDLHNAVPLELDNTFDTYTTETINKPSTNHNIDNLIINTTK